MISRFEKPILEKWFYSSLIQLNRDYAADLAISVKKWFLVLFFVAALKLNIGDILP